MNDLSFERSLTECCYGLVVIDQETWSVRLVTSRYKTSSKHRLNSLDASLKLGARGCWLCSNHSHRLAFRPQIESAKLFQTGHRNIARTCLAYLNYDNESITAPFSTDSKTIEGLVKSCRFTPFGFKYETVYPHILRNFPF
jgi:hypothetical protein